MQLIKCRYDSTGRTDEIKFDEVSWDDYFADLFDGVDRKILDDDRKKYQGACICPRCR